MEYEDLPQEAQAAFDTALEDFEGSVDENVRQKYVNGLERAVTQGSYQDGLARRFNMDVDDFSGLTEKWADSVAEPDPDEWEAALTAAGIPEKFRDNLVVGLTETEL